MKPFLTLCALLLLPAPALAQAPRYAEETQSAGLDGTYAGDWLYMVGGGAAGLVSNRGNPG
jgi:hypothetical protein